MGDGNLNGNIWTFSHPVEQQQISRFPSGIEINEDTSTAPIFAEKQQQQIS
jgi:hypothetical protein